MPTAGSSGTRAVLLIVIGGALLAFFALKLRVFSPAAPPRTQPSSSPSTRPAAAGPVDLRE